MNTANSISGTDNLGKKPQQPTITMASRKNKFEYGRGKDHQFYFRLKAGNGEVVAVGEGYRNELDCLKALQILCEMSRENTTVIRKPKFTTPPRFIFAPRQKSERLLRRDGECRLT